MQEAFRRRTKIAEEVNVQSLSQFHTLWMKLLHSRETAEKDEKQGVVKWFLFAAYPGEHFKKKATVKAKPIHTIFPGNSFSNMPSFFSSNFTEKIMCSQNE